MRVMAFSASLLKRIGMALHSGHVFFFMTLETHLPSIFEEQGRLVGLMGVVACRTFPIGSGVVFKGRFGDPLLQLIVTLKTQLVRGLNQ